MVDSLQNTTLVAPNRVILAIAEGEQDESTQFMAPTQRESVNASVKSADTQMKRNSQSESMSYCESNSNLFKIHLLTENGSIEQTRILSIESACDFEEIMDMIRKKFKITDSFKVTFKDEDGDFITMCDDADLMAALQISEKCTSVRLQLWCKLI